MTRLSNLTIDSKDQQTETPQQPPPQPQSQPPNHTEITKEQAEPQVEEEILKPLTPPVVVIQSNLGKEKEKPSETSRSASAAAQREDILQFNVRAGELLDLGVLEFDDTTAVEQQHESQLNYDLLSYIYDWEKVQKLSKEVQCELSEEQRRERFVETGTQCELYLDTDAEEPLLIDDKRKFEEEYVLTCRKKSVLEAERREIEELLGAVQQQEKRLNIYEDPVLLEQFEVLFQAMVLIADKFLPAEKVNLTHTPLKNTYALAHTEIHCSVYMLW